MISIATPHPYPAVDISQGPIIDSPTHTSHPFSSTRREGVSGFPRGQSTDPRTSRQLRGAYARHTTPWRMPSKRSWTSYVPACWFHVLSKGFLDEMGSIAVFNLWPTLQGTFDGTVWNRMPTTEQDGRSRHEGTLHCEKSIIVNLSYYVKVETKEVSH